MTDKNYNSNPSSKNIRKLLNESKENPRYQKLSFQLERNDEDKKESIPLIAKTHDLLKASKLIHKDLVVKTDEIGEELEQIK